MVIINRIPMHRLNKHFFSKSVPILEYFVHTGTGTPVHCKQNKVIGTCNVSTNPTRTAGLIVIGDEILKGQVQDTNSYFVSRVFYDLGIKVQRISIIGDSKDDIVKEIQAASSKYTYVITTGGIGPTHDDITFEAIAKAFDEPLILHPTLVKICREHFKSSDLTAAELKLANVPKSAKLTFGYDKVKGHITLYPNVAVRNVYVFPGVPQLMERLFTAVCDELFDGGNTQFFLKEIYLRDGETNIAQQLNKIVEEFPNVIFGSYPKFFDSYYKVRLTIESQNEHDTVKAYEKLKASFSESIIIDYDKDPLDNAYDKLLRLMKKQNHNHIQNAITIIESCCVKQRPGKICVYFNGEIESTAILHLYYACLKKNNTYENISAFFVQETEPTQELNKYLQETIARYNINIEILQGPSLSTIERYVTVHSERNVIIIGSTKVADDWTKHLQSVSKKSNVTLVQPLASWSRVEVWEFVLSLCLPYCSLYNQQQNQ